MSRVASKVRVMVETPSLPELEVMYRMPSTPLSSCSSGIVTEDSTTSDDAPMYVLVTLTVGGARSGYCEMGSVGSASRPASRMMMEQTAAKMGRLRKNSTMALRVPRLLSGGG